MTRSLAEMGFPLEKIAKAAEVDLETVRRWIEEDPEEDEYDDDWDGDWDGEFEEEQE